MLQFLSILAILHLALIVVGFPLLVIFFLCRSRRKGTLATKHTLAKFGSLYEDLNFEDGRALVYHLLFLMRRLLLIAQATFIGRDQQFLNMTLLMATSTMLLVYIVTVKPFDQAFMNQLEFFNESTILTVSAYHCIVFSDVA